MTDQEWFSLEGSMMAVDLYDGAMEVRKLREEARLLRAAVAAKGPVCPHCKSEMRPSRFSGYYEEFDSWLCNCETIPGAKENEVRGNYA